MPRPPLSSSSVIPRPEDEGHTEPGVIAAGDGLPVDDLGPFSGGGSDVVERREREEIGERALLVL